MKCFLFAVLMSLVVAVEASSQVTLNGNVQKDAEQVVPVPNTRVVVNGSYVDTADSKGQFSIKLSRDLIQGERVIIDVKCKDWLVNDPVDGEWNLPNFKYQNEQTKNLSSSIIIQRALAMLNSPHAICITPDLRFSSDSDPMPNLETAKSRTGRSME